MKKALLILFSILLAQICVYGGVCGAWAAVGDTYNVMAQKYGAPARVPLKRAFAPAQAERLWNAGAKNYSFKIGGFTVYAAFNSSGVCFRMVALHSRTLPPASIFVGRLAGTRPKVLSRIPRRAIALQYGAGANAVIYRSFGLPGNFNVEAYSKALEP
ncbi:MAG: hypothetical protein M0018_07070 [Nitrospiraceae bacterium]|nr:hypothetical protein [Nitrospiraceae bacterium]